jgi:aspartyl/asparaginyl beta-hydroxylase (cupin superfamily)
MLEELTNEMEQWCRNHHEELVQEFLNNTNNLTIWYEEDINLTQNWKTIVNKWQGQYVKTNLNILDKFCKQFESSILNCGFSVLEPQCEIAPHEGYTSEVIRFHYPLIVPIGDCGIKIGEKIFNWTEGTALIFDDTTTHSAWNRTNEIRVIILTDIKRNLNEY